MQKPTGKNLISWSLFPHCLNHVKKQLETAETLPLLYHKANNYKYHPDILGKYSRSRQIIKVKADNKYNIYYSKNKYIEKLWKFTFIPNKTINESSVAFCHIKVVFDLKTWWRYFRQLSMKKQVSFTFMDNIVIFVEENISGGFSANFERSWLKQPQ